MLRHSVRCAWRECSGNGQTRVDPHHSLLRTYSTRLTPWRPRNAIGLRQARASTILLSSRRHKSELQHHHEEPDERTAAFLHGDQRPSQPIVPSPVPFSDAAEVARAATEPRSKKSQKKGSDKPAQAGRKDRAPAGFVAKTVAYIQANMETPSPKLYPQVKDHSFKRPSSLLNHNMQVNPALKKKMEIIQIYSNLYQCTITFESPLGKTVADGHASKKAEAENAAHHHLFVKLHAAGQLGEIIDLKSTLNRTCRDQIRSRKQDDKDSLLDIYNYCARFNAIPIITSTSSSSARHGSGKTACETTIALPEQNIEVKATGKGPEKAIINASIKFKAAAEKAYTQNGNEALVIKDFNALTVDNAPLFIEFLKIVRPGVSIEADVKRKTNIGDHGAQMRLNGQPVGQPVVMTTKKKAEAVAMLTFSVQLKQQNPQLWPRFLQALRSGNGQILKPVSPIDLNLKLDCADVMRETIFAARAAGLPDDVETSEAFDAPDEPARRPPRSNDVDVKVRSAELEKSLEEFESDSKWAELRAKKADLPMNQYRAQVLDLINDNTYSIVVGATGSGKTTQVPQILLEDAIRKGEGALCNVMCTQPRRIAATSVGRRVAQERGERLQDSVGYQVRFDSKLPQPGGNITYCTTGILLQQLQHFPDAVMSQHSHIVVDEVHERDTLIDFLLILLKKNVHRRVREGLPVPRVVLMSATMDTELFADYFSLNNTPCPSISVPGRTYPVRERYIDEILQDMKDASTPLLPMRSDSNTRKYLQVEDNFKATGPTNLMDRTDRSVIDWKQEKKMTSTGEVVIADEKDNAVVPIGLVATTIAHIARTTSEGAILVFLPGLDEITKVHELLKGRNLGIDLTNEKRYKLYMLHSSIAQTQSTIFESVAAGCRKIILATNIAETSITIPDVQYVVDTGKLREKQYDSIRRITTLACTWISKSNSKQRAGRAGRVQNGNYFALFSKRRYDSFRAIGLPELLRTDLQETCLDIKAQAFSMPIREFLADALEPPAPAIVDSSVVNLQMLNALTEEEQITPLGRLLASLPVHPSLGKMIVLGIIFRCLDPMLILGAASSERSLFVQPMEQRQRARQCKVDYAKDSRSDHIALLNAINTLRHLQATRGEDVAREYAFGNMLHAGAFKVVDATARQIEQVLVDSGLIPWADRWKSPQSHELLNKNSHSVPLIKALLLAGLHPNLAVTPYGSPLFRTPGEKNVIIHPSSVNMLPMKRRENRTEGDALPRGQLFTYSQLAKSNDGNSLFMRDTSDATPLMAALFGGRLHPVEERQNILEVDEWLPLFVRSVDRRAPKTIVEFRKALDRLLTVAFNGLGQLTKQRSSGDAQTYLADEKSRETFASGLVDLLVRESKGSPQPQSDRARY